MFYFSNEMRRIRVIAMAKSINVANFFVANKVFIYTTFVVFVTTDYKMAAEAIFVTIALLHPVSIITLLMPWGVQFIAETLVAIERITVYVQCTYILVSLKAISVLLTRLTECQLMFYFSNDAAYSCDSHG